MQRYSTRFFIKSWYFFFTVLCVSVQWLLPPMPEGIPWRAGILLLAIWGALYFARAVTLSIVLESERLVVTREFGRRTVLGWGQIARVDQRQVGAQHAVRIYSTTGRLLELNSRWMDNLEGLTDEMVTRARLVHRGEAGSRLFQGIWDVWAV
ncbi:MAG: hypothetical protein AUJ92_13025 [Armatimonadetes bacterium CG2_30_59_28]|nr:hypothetical protein [Armatimonadota bacterium]OIO93093.1 MAG: hypothetical protein AUJ92_13025 [Armatimonadetes bacterium CG2_30_59_28]PIU60284.1 MAG: hypothetical protein COS85_25310 [Armatimonadetes bacterium CG07_land_8_20_14_0_80_59_28]PIX41124.1 MAG: hypothetical protein COZ56_12920 [Armatimonadetes bacterium CG_4_8_14_3_um_filter_58_9]PIY46964.1 MAG: hypothetical protein COZ05_05440 [Armatimonadetes bacterium CG_4_10_14_3_um_filter_59_10]